MEQLPVVPGPAEGGPSVIDCDSCLARSATMCGDCVVSVLLGGPPEEFRLDADERAAIETLAESGLVPPLRLVTPVAVDDARRDAG